MIVNAENRRRVPTKNGLVVEMAIKCIEILEMVLKCVQTNALLNQLYVLVAWVFHIRNARGHYTLQRNGVAGKLFYFIVIES